MYKINSENIKIIVKYFISLTSKKKEDETIKNIIIYPYTKNYVDIRKQYSIKAVYTVVLSIHTNYNEIYSTLLIIINLFFFFVQANKWKFSHP